MMEIAEPEVRGFMRHFDTLSDPRCQVNRGRLLIDLIVISICGVPAGDSGFARRPPAVESLPYIRQGPLCGLRPSEQPCSLVVWVSVVVERVRKIS
ncbi:MAG: hypothetical protein AB7O62_01505 [Pirellulales bacterium]